MTANTTTITATSSVDLAGMKTWEPAELSTFSLHAYNRVRKAFTSGNDAIHDMAPTACGRV